MFIRKELHSTCLLGFKDTHNFSWWETQNSTLQGTLNVNVLVPSVESNNFFLCNKAHASHSEISSPTISDHSPTPTLSCTPCLYGWGLPQDITSLLKRAAQRSRCLLCENTTVAWRDPDNEQTITQLSRPQRRPVGGGWGGCTRRRWGV